MSTVIVVIRSKQFVYALSVRSEPHREEWEFVWRANCYVAMVTTVAVPIVKVCSKKGETHFERDQMMPTVHLSLGY